MTTELEKQFFSIFGIESKIKDLTPAQILYSDIKRLEYPQISDRQYLELICVLNPYSYPSGKNIQHLKEGILEWCIKFKNDIKYQVQAIFKGER